MPKRSSPHKPRSNTQGKDFHFELLNGVQKAAWAAFQQHDVLFLLGPAGTGKTFLAVAFAIKQILAKEQNKVILTRPIVESGESLGYLPGTFEEKVNPYMMPMYDCMDKLIGREGPHREKIIQASEIAPIAYMRGRTFNNAICIFDEAQNATMAQLKLFMTRFGENSKIIITGDPKQSDIRGPVALADCVRRLNGVPGIGIIEFKASSIVRNPMIASILEKLEDEHSDTLSIPKQELGALPKITDLYPKDEEDYNDGLEDFDWGDDD